MTSAGRLIALAVGGATLSGCGGTGEREASGPPEAGSVTSASVGSVSANNSTDAATVSGVGGTHLASGGAGGGAAGGSTGDMEGTVAGGTGPGGGSASDSGGAGAGGGGEATCVDVSHVDERQRDDLHVIGTGFESDDGQIIRIVVTHGEPTYGLAEAPIENGSFDILLPGVLGDYTGIAVHVDRVRDNACNPDTEFIWQWITGPAPGDTLWEVTPDTLMIFDEVGPCSLNGIFDLATVLMCPAED